jgi:glucose/arabinose dehydrogenase
LIVFWQQLSSFKLQAFQNSHQIILLKMALKKLLLTVAILTATYGWGSLQAQTIITQTSFPGVFVPQVLGLTTAGDGSGYLYAISQQGRIYRFDQNSSNPSAVLWLDISDRLISGGERGLLGMAFHPDFVNNGLFYVNYTAPTPLRTVISSFETDASTGAALPDSETILLVFNQPFTNHNGGHIAFGPDGYLYIATGDGGSSGDPQNNAQNTQNLLGAILRIDVDNAQDGLNYAIPAGNPFAGTTEGRDEIFAWGLRNPWRFSFDTQNETLWAGDVGQNAWEVIHIIENGLNYGWRIIEGSHCYNPPQNCNTAGLEMPVYEYSHSNGDRSITGGYVYYGSKNPALWGKYIYGDYVSGRIWALSYDYETGEVLNNVQLANLPNNIASFGLDDAGELYILTHNGGSVLGLLASPLAPDFQTPGNGEVVDNTHLIGWSEGPVVDQYQLQISQSPFFENIVADVTTNETQHELSLPNGTYYARVKAINEAGQSGFSAVLQYVVTGTTNLDENPAYTRQLKIVSVMPNPAVNEVRISFELPVDARASLIIYNLLGEQVMQLPEQEFRLGKNEAVIMLHELVAGLYFVRLVSNNQTDTRKILVTK